jgi:hypothetical protein
VNTDADKKAELLTHFESDANTANATSSFLLLLLLLFFLESTSSSFFFFFFLSFFLVFFSAKGEALKNLKYFFVT